MTQTQPLHFLGLGSQRCASTYLNHVLAKHPLLYVPIKEFNFWSGSITKEKFENYLKSFKNQNSNNCFFGEISPSYAAMYREEVALVKELMPNLKVILIIRNPVDRLVSSITRQWTYYYVDSGASTNKNIFFLLRYVDSGLSRRLTDYLRTYNIWTKQFGKDNVFLDKFENLSSYPQDVLMRILNFLEVQPIVEDSMISTKPNKSKEYVKAEIPEFIKWYIAVEWLPKVKRMSVMLPLDLSDWVEYLQSIVDKNKFNINFWIIYIIHKIYFFIPYNLFYSLLKFFQIKIKVEKTRQELDL